MDFGDFGAWTSYRRIGRENAGAAARKFASRIAVGMAGINVGVSAPMAFFPFGGVKESGYGDLRCHGKDAVAFYTQQRTVVSRWPDER